MHSQRSNFFPLPFGGLKLIQLRAASGRSVPTIVDMNPRAGGSFPAGFAPAGAEPLSTLDQLSMATWGTQDQAKAVTCQGLAVGTGIWLQGLKLVLCGAVALPEAPCPHNRGWQRTFVILQTLVSPPGLITAMSQQESRLPMHARKAQLCQSSLRQVFSKPFPKLTLLCAFAKEVLPKQVFEYKVLLLTEKQRLHVIPLTQRYSKLPYAFFSPSQRVTKSQD